MSGLGQLRYEPTAKRIRAVLDGSTIIDSTRAALVWEPGRIVPSFAVPAEDIRGDLVQTVADTADPSTDGIGVAMPEVSMRPVLDPSISFTVHTAKGQRVDIHAAGQARPGAGFQLADEDLAGYVVLDFSAFDAWLEEDEPAVAHPRDPFHRVDVLASSRHVRVERDGEVLADSTHPVLLFETLLPTRYYLPLDDVRVELVPSQTETYCAYKGQASYLSGTLEGGMVRDLAWTYQSPRREVSEIRDLVAFFNERVDVVVDGLRQERPITPWS
jgi:uncharacterized protein (DUF427 family)